MALGTRNTSAYFQSLMYLLDVRHCRVYIDDYELVFPDNMTDHISNLFELFCQVSKAMLTLLILPSVSLIKSPSTTLIKKKLVMDKFSVPLSLLLHNDSCPVMHVNNFTLFF